MKTTPITAILFRASRIAALANGVMRYGLTEKQRERMDYLRKAKITPEPLTELQQSKYDTFALRIDSGETLTDKQMAEFVRLKEKRTTPKGLTEVQAAELQNLKELDAKEPELSKGAKTYIKEVWLENERGYREELNNKFLTKGKQAEEDSIDLLCAVDNQFHIKNKEFKKKGHICGTCDLQVTIPELPNELIIDDIKTSWSPLTFIKSELKSEYEWQLRAYMMLYNADLARLRYCLVDCPPDVYEDEFRKFCFANNILDDTLDEYHDLVVQFKRNHIYTKCHGLKNSERDELEKLYKIQAPTADQLARIDRLEYIATHPFYTPAERVKTFILERDYTMEAAMIEAADMAAEYYQQISLNML